MASKNGRMKKKCQAYTASGHLQTNKAEKKKRHEKRMAKFEAKKGTDKEYQYVALDRPSKDASKEEKKKYYAQRRDRASKNVDRRTPFQKMRSLFSKVDKIYSEQKKIAWEAMGASRGGRKDKDE